MSIRHGFKFKLKDYIFNMRLCFPSEPDFMNRVTDRMIAKGQNLRELPTVVLAIVYEQTELNGHQDEDYIINLVRQVTRHILGMPSGLNIKNTLIYFSKHVGWNYYLYWGMFKKLIFLFTRFSEAHHRLQRNYHI